jgi:hypothetical protein
VVSQRPKELEKRENCSEHVTLPPRHLPTLIFHWDSSGMAPLTQLNKSQYTQLRRTGRPRYSVGSTTAAGDGMCG